MIFLFAYSLIFVSLLSNGILANHIYRSHKRHKENVKVLHRILMQKDLENEQFERLLLVTHDSKMDLDNAMSKMGESIVDLQKILLNALSEKKSN